MLGLASCLAASTSFAARHTVPMPARLDHAHSAARSRQLNSEIPEVPRLSIRAGTAAALTACTSVHYTSGGVVGNRDPERAVRLGERANDTYNHHADGLLQLRRDQTGGWPRGSTMTATLIKSHGIQYTPPELAKFLASVTWNELPRAASTIDVLDPACGDGILLEAFATKVPRDLRQRLNLFGYETDGSAIEVARKRLLRLGTRSVTLVNGDFLSTDGVAGRDRRQLGLFGDAAGQPRFDVVIANPPYVRTQVLGAARAKELARRFGLAGRIDLYHAFIRAITGVLKPAGTLGLLTSNRLLTIRSGTTIRQLLRSEFHLHCIFDLGDTKLFEAAVLPVIVVGTRKAYDPNGTPCRFDRVYEYRQERSAAATQRESLLDALLESDVHGVVNSAGGTFRIERGVLSHGERDYVWSLTNADYLSWMNAVRASQACRFEDVAKVRVGIKTTADEVFIRRDWSGIEIEAGILRPLLTHADSGRWKATKPCGSAKVLYPHVERNGRRRAIALGEFPGAAAYLRAHEKRLRQRRYVTDSGREWYEIWVPHQPGEWAKPKIVFPDISEHPRFFLDTTGALVSGECYWMVVSRSASDDWLLLMLAVANSTFAARFYDIAFHNKLYAGRRRFQTQYVGKFPLPSLETPVSREIVKRARALVAGGPDQEREESLDELVWRAFGLTKEIVR
ncbi:MAG: Eco57I restriction-modification methylase domain-containing protein [Planctomycetaceae bacterium]